MAENLTEFFSPLGNDSQLYRDKKSETAGIIDAPEVGTIEMYSAGYTKHNRTGQSRQEAHLILWSAARQLGKSPTTLWPFNSSQYKIELVPDITNEFDPNAVSIIFSGELKMPEGSTIFKGNLDLGYVPMRISKHIKANLDKINTGKVLKVRSEYHGKYYTTKVIFGYNNTTFDSNITPVDLIRFRDLVE